MINCTPEEVREAHSTPTNERTTRQQLIVKQTPEPEFEFVSKLPETTQLIGTGKYQESFKPKADAMRRNPGRWMVIGRHLTLHQCTNRASSIRRGKYKGTSPAGSFETAIAKTDSGTYELYVRYIKR